MYDLYLPHDEDLFRWLILEYQHLLKESLRSALDLKLSRDMAISDKGQNLRGVISMFDDLSQASKFLTNQYWRNLLRKWKGEADGNKVHSQSYILMVVYQTIATRKRD